MILLIDNYDSFSYNLYQAVGMVDSDIRVIKNDELTAKEIEKLYPEHIIISPGPGRPADAGVCEEVIKTMAGKCPILGVCLGHQAICEVFGAQVIYAKELMHGDEDEAYIRLLKSKTKVPIIRAVRIAEVVDLEIADATMADFPLLDTYHKDSYGGTGMSFDWSYLKSFSRPYFLAGGIGEDNIVEAINTGAYCLDISSGAETDGYKDPDKIAFLCQKAHEQ